MIPAVRNATLTQIEAAGTSEDYGQAATVGSSKWSGTSPAHLVEETKTTTMEGPTRSGGTSGSAMSEVVTTRITFDSSLATVVVDDHVTYSHNGTSFTRKIRDLRLEDLTGTVRCELRDA